MSWAGKSHLVEKVAEWGAPIVLAWAVGWSARRAALPLAATAACALFALAVGIFVMRRAGQSSSTAAASFEPADFEYNDSCDELLLDNPLLELLLDDPLVEASQDSRVVQLFARQDPTPGELVLRISDYLNDSGNAPAPATAPMEQEPVDASTALHAALANIRASLR